MSSTPSTPSTQEVIDQYDSPVLASRAAPLGHPNIESRLVAEYSDWRQEQKSWRDGAAFLHQSEHMSDFFVKGPDALKVFRDLSINGYRTFTPGQAKQFVALSPEGLIIGDGILMQLEENSFDLIGDATLAMWVQYNIEIGDYDVEFTADHPNHWFTPLRSRETDPILYRFEVQGPKALQVIEKAIGGAVPEVKLFNMTEFTIAGHTVNAVRHGMAGQPGFEFFGPYAEGEDVRSAILEAGAEFGITPVGSIAYFTTNLESGWFVATPALLAGESMRAFREWLPANVGVLPYTGSYKPENIEDYYLTPYDIGYDFMVSNEHEFIGREALAARDPKLLKTKVTLIWDEDDFGKLYTDTVKPETGLPPQFRSLHDVSFESINFDAVQVDGKTIGFTAQSGYVADDRRFISLAAIDPVFAEPGTQVTILWGDDVNPPRADIAPHAQVSVRATVAPTPFSDYAREQYRK
ncbi:MAG TPA: aminomethyl transferase family protein [Pseudolysinimonas sp.]|nr:aminomethyl transferase family protein [Pseudolysinimonas sp.]